MRRDFFCSRLFSVVSALRHVPKPGYGLAPHYSTSKIYGSVGATSALVSLYLRVQVDLDEGLVGAERCRKRC